jgi:hypothetical protein
VKYQYFLRCKRTELKKLFKNNQRKEKSIEIIKMGSMLITDFLWFCGGTAVRASTGLIGRNFTFAVLQSNLYWDKINQISLWEQAL